MLGYRRAHRVWWTGESARRTRSLLFLSEDHLCLSTPPRPSSWCGTCRAAPSCPLSLSRSLLWYAECRKHVIYMTPSSIACLLCRATVKSNLYVKSNLATFSFKYVFENNTAIVVKPPNIDVSLVLFSSKNCDVIGDVSRNFVAFWVPVRSFY